MITILNPQDILEIKNLQDLRFLANDVSQATGSSTAQGQTFEVKNDGTVNLPSLGKVLVAGLTRVEANDLIQSMYHKVLLKDPIIEVRIVNLKVTLFGEIKTQGAIPLVKDRTTLVEMIGIAGGLTDRANETNVKIIRGTEKNPKVTEIDLSNIQSINDPRAVLQSGDIVYVSENRRAIRIDKLSNFSTLYQPAILLFNTALIIISLIRR